MPRINPFEETMRAGVPQRVTRPTMRDVAGPARREPSDIPPWGGGRAYNQPGFERPMTNVPSRFGPPANIGFDRMGGAPADIGLDRMGGRPGIFGGRNAYDANDIISEYGLSDTDTMRALLGGLDETQYGPEAGVDIAGSPGMDEQRIFKKLWGKAVNKFPPGTSDTVIRQEWERLKNIFRGKAYGSGIMKGLTKGNPLGLMMDMMPVEPALESIDQLINPDPIII